MGSTCFAVGDFDIDFELEGHVLVERQVLRGFLSELFWACRVEGVCRR